MGLLANEHEMGAGGRCGKKFTVGDGVKQPGKAPAWRSMLDQTVRAGCPARCPGEAGQKNKAFPKLFPNKPAPPKFLPPPDVPPFTPHPASMHRLFLALLCTPLLLSAQGANPA